MSHSDNVSQSDESAVTDMKHLVLFDFDGTLTFEDTFTRFIYFAVPTWRRVLGFVLLLPLYLGYKSGVVSSSLMRRCVVWMAFRGVAESGLKQAGLRFSNEYLNTVLQPEAMQWLTAHRDKGDHIVVVSASLALYLQPWCEMHNLQLLCNELVFVNGRATGRYTMADCAGAEKARRVVSVYALSDYDCISAYGDTPEDHAMLSLATFKTYRGKPLTP